MNTHNGFQNEERLLQFHIESKKVDSQPTMFQNYFSSHMPNGFSNQGYHAQVPSEVTYAEPQNNEHQTSSKEKKTIGIVKGAWTKDEDSILSGMVAKIGPERWVLIAKELGSRTGKQCRERWHNHLDPNIIRSPFTKEEDSKIWDMFNTIGPRWAYMAKEMPGRPDNTIKNHFNTFLRPRRLLKKQEAELQKKFPSSEIKVADNLKNNNTFSQQNQPVKQQKIPKLLKKPKKESGFSKKKVCASEEPSSLPNNQSQPAHINNFSSCMNNNQSMNTLMNPPPFYPVSKHPQHGYYPPNMPRQLFNQFYPNMNHPLTPSLTFNPVNINSFVPSNLTSPLINNMHEESSDMELIRQLGHDLGVTMDPYS